MFVSKWLRSFSHRYFNCRTMRRAPVRRRVRPWLEVLEDRTAPAVFNVGPGDVATLIADINQANTNGQSNTINLTPSTYNLTAINNYWYGPDGLPAISSNLTINGHGATMQRDTSAGTPDFRLFYVSGGFDGLPAGSLTLEDLTLEGGVAQGGDSSGGGGGLGAGGAIFNQGTLNLTGVTLVGNQAVGGSSAVQGWGNGGGGIGQNAPVNGAGGGFGGPFPGGSGGNGGPGSSGGGGGGGFGTGDSGNNASGNAGGAGGGPGGLGGNGGGSNGGMAGDGGGGSGSGGVGSGGEGGSFGFGGAGGDSGGGGGIGAGGGAGSLGSGGGGGFGGGGGQGGQGGSGVFASGGFGGGGGGGQGGNGSGAGGFGGGNGGPNGFGGGGAGLGGALFNMDGQAILTNCTFTTNTAQGGNGGASAGGGSGYGGAIFNLDGNLNLTFCTLAGNTVAVGSGSSVGSNGNVAGGDLYNLAYGNATTTGTAVSATAAIFDSILADSQGGVDLVNNAVNGKHTNTATVTLQGPNLVMSSTGTISGTSPLTANPQLGPLQNNGGPTMTMALQPGSPAIGAGMAIAGVTTDQRDFIRPNTPSLGAFDPLATPPVPTLQLTSVGIVPNLFKGTAQVTLTVQMSNPEIAVNEGVASVTWAEQSANGQVVNGTALVQLTVPLLDVISNRLVSLAYTDNATPASFGAGSTTVEVALNLWNALSSAEVSLTADGGELDTVPFFFAPLEYVYTNHQWTELRYGPLDVHVEYTNINGDVMVTLNGVPWQVAFFAPQGQFFGYATVALTNDGGAEVMMTGVSGQVLGTTPL
jgi:hypothetical protein